MRKHRQEPPQKRSKDRSRRGDVASGGASEAGPSFTHLYGPAILCDHGPLLFASWDLTAGQREIMKPEVSRAITPASGVILLDTGATSSCIAQWVANDLGLIPLRFARGHGAGGEHENPVYAAKLTIPILDVKNNRSTRLVWQLSAQGIPKMEETTTHRVLTYNGKPCRLIGLLGRDVLRRFRIFYDGPAGSVRLDLVDRGGDVIIETS